MKEPKNQLSRFLSLVLRHQPEKIEIRLDPNGWTPVNKLLEALAKHGHPITKKDLEEIVAIQVQNS